MTDPITDLFNRIKNAQALHTEYVYMPASKLKLAVLGVLKKEGLINDFEKKSRLSQKNIKVILKYHDKVSAFSGFQRISRPGQRIYVKGKEISRLKKGYGMAIVSTSQGVMSGKEARKKGLGGEALVEIW